mmetsp:Transcript_155742/g.499209  ORF Transcript_155742/g.499209 Transcript_155742/m.499209 type:complete len:415 (+) Transcript_155742:128-1372(+)
MGEACLFEIPSADERRRRRRRRRPVASGVPGAGSRRTVDGASAGHRLHTLQDAQRGAHGRVWNRRRWRWGLLPLISRRGRVREMGCPCGGGAGRQAGRRRPRLLLLICEAQRPQQGGRARLAAARSTSTSSHPQCGQATDSTALGNQRLVGAGLELEGAEHAELRHHDDAARGAGSVAVGGAPRGREPPERCSACQLDLAGRRREEVARWRARRGGGLLEEGGREPGRGRRRKLRGVAARRRRLRGGQGGGVEVVPADGAVAFACPEIEGLFQGGLRRRRRRRELGAAAERPDLGRQDGRGRGHLAHGHVVQPREISHTRRLLRHAEPLRLFAGLHGTAVADVAEGAILALQAPHRFPEEGARAAVALLVHEGAQGHTALLGGSQTVLLDTPDEGGQWQRHVLCGTAHHSRGAN